MDGSARTYVRLAWYPRVSGRSELRVATQRQVQANQANAQGSTGPRSSDGKATSSLNSLRHGAYATRPVAIPRGRLAEDPGDVAAFVDSVIGALIPRDTLEYELAHRIAMSCLRLRRLGRFEADALAADGTIPTEEISLLESLAGIDTSPEGQEERAAVRAFGGNDGTGNED